DGDWEVLGDPTEAAFLVAAQKIGLSESRNLRFVRVDEVPFSSDRKLMSTLHSDADFDAARSQGERVTPSELTMFTKGSPDVLLERCGHELVGGRVVALTDRRRQAILDTIDGL